MGEAVTRSEIVVRVTGEQVIRESDGAVLVLVEICHEDRVLGQHILERDGDERSDP